jgi:hypothetical protein
VRESLGTFSVGYMSHCILRFVRSSAYVAFPDAQVYTPLGGRHRRRDEGRRVSSHSSPWPPRTCRSSTKYRDQLDRCAPPISLLLSADIRRRTPCSVCWLNIFVILFRLPFSSLTSICYVFEALSCDSRCNVFAAMRSLTNYLYLPSLVYIFTPPACTYTRFIQHPPSSL